METFNTLAMARIYKKYHMKTTEPGFLSFFYSKIKKCKRTDCWLWTGGLTTAGYASSALDGKRKYIHRVSFELFKKKSAKGKEVCHSCDTPSCVNPDHLFLGTHKDNFADAARKGRMIPSRVVLRQRDILEIRNLLKKGMYQKDVAKQFGVSRSAILGINSGRTWSWLRCEKDIGKKPYGLPGKKRYGLATKDRWDRGDY